MNNSERNVCFKSEDKVDYTYSRIEYDRYLGREYKFKCESNKINSEKTFILLSGWMGSGKDYIGDIIEKEYGYKKKQISKNLKDEVSEIYGISRDLLETQEGKKKRFSKKETYRDLLIRHGQEKKVHDKQYWMKRMVVTDDRTEFPKATRTELETRTELSTRTSPEGGGTLSLLSGSPEGGGTLSLLYECEKEAKTVISDWRFQEEYDLLEEIGVKIITIRIERFDNIESECVSEHSLDDFDFDYIISNKKGTTKTDIIEKLRLILR
jgi:hypothetical protein